MAEATTLKSNTFFTPKRISRMAILIALSGVGAFVKIPSPSGDLGIDSAPGYFAGMVKKWDWKEAQIIGMFARLLAAWVVGFPFGIPIQLCWGLFLGASMGIIVRVPRLKWGLIPGAIAGTLFNGPIFALLVIPASVMLVSGGNWSAAFAVGVASILGATIASALAIAIGVGAHEALARTNITE
jgi:riboflavin transporter